MSLSTDAQKLMTPQAPPDNSAVQVNSGSDMVSNAQAAANAVAPNGAPTPSGPPTSGVQVQPRGPNSPQPRQVADQTSTGVSTQKPQEGFLGRVFRNVLTTMHGGPQYTPVTGPDGKYTGQVQQVYPTKGRLAAGILAGAITSMVAGMAAPDKYNPNGSRDLSPSAAAGVQAMQAKMAPTTQTGAKQKADEQINRQASIAQHNLQQHALALSVGKQDLETQQANVDMNAPLAQALEMAQQEAASRGENLVRYADVSDSEFPGLVDSNGIHITKDSAIPIRVEQVGTNADGSPHYETHWMVFDPNALVKATDELRKTDPAFAAIPPGMPVRAAVFAKAAQQSGFQMVAQNVINQMRDRTDEIAGTKTKAVDIKTALSKYPSLIKFLPNIGRYAGLDPDEAIDQMRKDGADPAAVAGFAALVGFDQHGKTEWSQYREAENKKIDVLSHPDQQPASPEEVDFFRKDVESADPTYLDPTMKIDLTNLPDGVTKAELKERKDAFEKAYERGMDRDLHAQALLQQKGDKADTRNDKSYQYNSTLLDKWGKPIDDLATRFSREWDTINQMSPQADAFVAPELLSVMAGGSGSGLRMNEAEISRVIGGRGKFEDLKAALMKWNPNSGQALSVTAEQRKEMLALTKVVYQRIQAKQRMLEDARSQLADPDSTVTDHRQVMSQLKRNLDAVDNIQNVPAGKVPAYNKYGVVVGYADDNKGKNAVYFNAVK